MASDGAEVVSDFRMTGELESLLGPSAAVPLPAGRCTRLPAAEMRPDATRTSTRTQNK